MRGLRLVAVACSTITLMSFTNFEQEYYSIKKQLIADPAFRKQKLIECINGINNNQRNREAFALMVNAPADKVAKLSCDRMLKAWLDGRMTVDIHVKFRRDGITSPESIRIIQGR